MLWAQLTTKGYIRAKALYKNDHHHHQVPGEQLGAVQRFRPELPAAGLAPAVSPPGAARAGRVQRQQQPRVQLPGQSPRQPALPRGRPRLWAQVFIWLYCRLVQASTSLTAAPALSTGFLQTFLQVGSLPGFAHKSSADFTAGWYKRPLPWQQHRLWAQVFFRLSCRLVHFPALHISLPQTLMQVSTSVHFAEDSPGFKRKSSTGFAVGWYKRPLPSFEHRSSLDFAAGWHKHPLPSFEHRSSLDFAAGWYKHPLPSFEHRSSSDFAAG